MKGPSSIQNCTTGLHLVYGFYWEISSLQSHTKITLVQRLHVETFLRSKEKLFRPFASDKAHARVDPGRFAPLSVALIPNMALFYESLPRILLNVSASIQILLHRKAIRGLSHCAFVARRLASIA